MTLYDDDLAFVHDAGFTALAEAAARMVEELSPPCRVVDLGCGGGTLLAELAEVGFEPVGVDVSPAMVALARRRMPQAPIEVGSAYDFVLPDCGVVTAVGEVFNYRDAPRAADPTAHTDRFIDTLSRIHAALRPGGFLLFDVATHGRAPEPTHAERRGPGWRVEATAVEQDGMLVRAIDTWRTVAGVERHRREEHHLHLWDADEMTRILGRVGFEVERLGGYDDFGFQEGWDGFLARR